MKKSLHLLLPIVFPFVLAACGSTSTAPPVSDEEAINAVLDRLEVDCGEVVDNVDDFRINGWQEVNERNLIVEAGVNSYYLLSLSSFCPELNFATRIAMDIRGFRLTRGDTVLVTSNRMVTRCQIDEITELVDR